MADFGTPTAKVVTDLSGGQVPDDQKALIDSRLLLDKQKYRQREWFFAAALAACGIMSAVFLLFVYKVLCLAESNGGIVPDWHLLLLGSGLIIPPTVILFGLMRLLYKVEASRDEAPDSGEMYPVFHALLSAMKDVFQR